MDRFVVILFSLLVATTPLISSTLRSCDCAAPLSGSENTSVQPATAHPCCDTTRTSETDRDTPNNDQDHEQDHDCDCPLGCCGIVHAPIANPSAPEIPFTLAPSLRLAVLDEQRMGPPHLQGLTRPPRPTPSL